MLAPAPSSWLCLRCWLAVLLLNLLPVQPDTGFAPVALSPKKRWTPAAQGLSKACCARGPAPIFPEDEWRRSAEAHRQRVLALLEDGFAPEEQVPHRFLATQKHDGFRKLNERHAVFNFLHEYYNIRGAKGTRRIGRWSPGIPVFTLQGATAQDLENGTLSPVGCTVHGRGITYDARTHFENASDGVATSFMWYHALLSATSQAEPVLHCYNLHEWAMQYWPAGAAAPPSRKYQLETMPLRVSQETINAVVEEKGIRCTHVDALRFFAPAAGPLNRHGASLERQAQLGLEQPGCVHAHMDLLKISLRLSPWVPAELLADCLELALAARSLDVAASPYDTSKFGLIPIPIETDAGRKHFRRRQEELMATAAPIRARLLECYELFLREVFGPERLQRAEPSPDRYASAQPGGLPWRRSLIAREP